VEFLTRAKDILNVGGEMESLRDALTPAAGLSA
jgi:hypothetical protein